MNYELRNEDGYELQTMPVLTLQIRRHFIAISFVHLFVLIFKILISNYFAYTFRKVIGVGWVGMQGGGGRETRKKNKKNS
jgi:hypothetical protein